MELKISLTRIYNFSAAHRLNSENMDVQKNIKIYDKCNNQLGHGHNYKLELTIKGTIDRETGMLVPLKQLDNKVNSILAELDYKHLDNEVPFFANTISSGENIVQYLWHRFNKIFNKNQLYHLKLWETNNNSFDLGKD